MATHRDYTGPLFPPSQDGEKIWMVTDVTYVPSVYVLIPLRWGQPRIPCPLLSQNGWLCGEKCWMETRLVMPFWFLQTVIFLMWVGYCNTLIMILKCAALWVCPFSVFISYAIWMKPKQTWVAVGDIVTGSPQGTFDLYKLQFYHLSGAKSNLNCHWGYCVCITEECNWSLFIVISPSGKKRVSTGVIHFESTCHSYWFRVWYCQLWDCCTLFHIYGLFYWFLIYMGMNSTLKWQWTYVVRSTEWRVWERLKARQNFV